jgi:hypothetical protein
LNIHTSIYRPSRIHPRARNITAAEIDALVDAQAAMAGGMSSLSNHSHDTGDNNDNSNDTHPGALILGDLNAACSYVTAREWPRIRLRSLLPNMNRWWIPDDAKTNLAPSSRCAYDRFVSVGDRVADMIAFAEPFAFDRAYNLSYAFAKTVSDHYPIELTLMIPEEVTLLPEADPFWAQGTIAGACVASAIIVCLLMCWCHYRRRARQRRQVEPADHTASSSSSSSSSTPFVLAPATDFTDNDEQVAISVN